MHSDPRRRLAVAPAADRGWALAALEALLQAPPAHFHIPATEGVMRHLPGKLLHVMPELFVQLEGTNRIAFPAETLSLPAGHACLIPRGLPHGETFLPERGRFRMLVFMFDRARIDFHQCVSPDGVSSREERHGTVNDTEIDRIVALLDDLALLAQRADAWSAGTRAALQRGVVQWLAGTLARPGSAPRLHPKIFHALRLISVRLESSALGTAFLARQIGCAPAYLSALFHAQVGVSPVRYIQEQRLQKARYLLTHSSMSIKEIGAVCGFEGADYFGRVFRRLTGQSPRRYRAAHPDS